MESQFRLLEAIRLSATGRDPRGQRPLTAAEARLVAVAIETDSVYPGTAKVTWDLGSDQRARQQGRTIKKREERVRKRYAAEGKILSPATYSDLHSLLEAALRNNMGKR